MSAFTIIPSTITDTSPTRSRAREYANDPWHDSTSHDPWSTKGSASAPAQMSPVEFRIRYAHLKAVASAWSPQSASTTVDAEGVEISTELTTSHLVPGAPSSWSAAPYLADAPEAIAESIANQLDSTHSVGLSEGCARILTMAANPLQDEHGSEAERVEPKPSFGTYEESDSSGRLPLIASSSSEVEAGPKSDDSEVDFLERLRLLQLDVQNRRKRRAKKRRPVFDPPGLCCDHPEPAVARGRTFRPALQATSCRVSAFGRRRGRQFSPNFPQQFSHQFSHDMHVHDSHTVELQPHDFHTCSEMSGTGSVGDWTSGASGNDGIADRHKHGGIDSGGAGIGGGLAVGHGHGHGHEHSDDEDDVHDADVWIHAALGAPFAKPEEVPIPMPSLSGAAPSAGVEHSSPQLSPACSKSAVVVIHGDPVPVEHNRSGTVDLALHGQAKPARPQRPS